MVRAFDESGLRQVLQQSKTEVVINQLTALPSDPSQIAAAIQGDRKLRLEGAATCCLPRERPACADTCRQLSGFFLKARGVLADESDGLAIDASAGVARSAQMYAELESRLERTEPLECVGLRYGFF